MIRVLWQSVLVIGVLALLTRLVPFMFHAQVTSWFRNPKKNREVGGNAKSLHLVGWAVDIVPRNSPVYQKLQRLPFGKPILEDDHIHWQLF